MLHPGDDEFLPVCRPVGKCGKGGKGGDGSCLEDEDQCVDVGGTFCSGKDGGKGKDNGGKGKKGKKGKKDGKNRR